ncbi:ATP-binding protein, partial [Caballeronia sp. RCC_10]|uniref:ATP-binding protein n=1 Tax=Caballeronia sp. RCC_10 TaxID=3239227 RepID=UPI00352503DD
FNVFIELPVLCLSAHHSGTPYCNRAFSGWTDVFPDPAMTVAAIDRLVHHSTIFELNVESYRRRNANDNKTARRRQLPHPEPEGTTTMAN